MNFGRVAPSFMIIGVQKGGTTSLHKYLLQHPRLLAPKPKELHFFDTFNEVEMDDYLVLFPKKYLTNSHSFESTPRYIYHPAAAGKLYRFNPKLKFVVLLRNPVDRAYSAWNMFKLLSQIPEKTELAHEIEEKDANEKIYSYFYKKDFPSFHDWVTFELNGGVEDSILEPSIVRRGYYKEQIERYLEFFPKDQFLFIDSTNLKKNTLEVLNSISEFLNISTFKNLKLNLKMTHQGSYKEPMQSDTYQMLLDHFQEKNKGLDALINLELPWLKR